MNRVLGTAANVGMLLLGVLIAANGALAYYYLHRISADIRRADEGQAQQRWTEELNGSERSAAVSLINATLGALLLSGAVYALVRRDVRARLEAQKLRQAEEARFHRLVEMDAMGVLFIEVDGRVTDASDKFLTMIGYPREDLMAGRINWRSLTPAEYDPADQVALADLERRGIAKPYEKAFLRRDGSRVPVLLGCARLESAPTKTNCICYAIDLSESRAAQATIQRLNHDLQDRVHELETLFEVAPVGLGLASDPECKHIAVNGVLATMLGIPASANASLTAPLDERPATYQLLRDAAPLAAESLPMQQVAASGQPLANQEFEILRSDGKSIRVLCSVAPLFDDQRRSRGCVGAFMDITHLKEIELSLVRNNQAKDAMLTMLGHELRNPLAALTGAAELIATQQPDEAIYQQSMLILRRQLQQLARLVNDMLDLAKITAAKARLRLAPLDVSGPLRAAIAVVQPLIDSRGHELRVDAAAEPLAVEGDAARLQQAFVNLLNNAAKFTEPGGKIDVSAGIDDGRVKVRVRDTGIGLDPSRIASMFDLFAQVSPDLDRADAGLGIGLTMAHSLVKLHGGVLTASSAGQGRGSEFVVELPLAASAMPAEKKPVPGSPPVEPLTVLIVEDQPDIGRIMQALLSRYGHYPHWAASGAEGLELATKMNPDVAFVDIGLPGMNGYELARKFRADSRFDRMMLIALTGYGQKEDRERSKEAGFTHHLVKPIDATTLVQMLEECSRRQAM